MALKQQISVPLTLLGDGSSTAFAYAISNLYQSANGYALPFGSAGVVPSSVTVTGSSEPVTSATVDANGNITITFTTAPANGELVTLQLNIIWNSGAAVSSSPTQTSLVTLSGASTVGITGTVAVTQSTSPWVVSNGGTFAVQAAQSGTWNIGTVTAVTAITNALPAGANTIGAVTQASGPWTINETQLNSVALGSPSNYGTSPGAVSVQGVNAFITNTVPVTLTSTTITGTVAVTQSTSPWVVSNGGTFAVQAAQSGTWTNTVTQATAANLNATMVGTLTHNNAAPAATNIGALVAIASTAAPTYTTGDQVLLSTDLSGNLRVTFAAASEQNVNLNQWAGTTLGTPANYGTSPGAVVAGSVNAFVTNTVAVTLASTTITGTVAVTQSTSPWVVSGTVTANAGTGTFTVGGPAASGAAVSGNPILNGGVFNTTQPTVTTGQIVDLQTTARGGLIVATGVDGFNVTNAGTFAVQATVSGTVAVTQSTSPWVVSNSGTFAVQATQTTSPWVVGGPAASGSAATGNPILNGAVFNTTQPTVTTGQIVDMQATARGALIVATGIDPFTVSQSNTGIVNTTLATWTSATALNTAAAPYTNSLLYSVVQLIINQVGTFSGGIVTFEASLDNTNWYAINGTNVQGTSQSNLTFTTNTLSQFTFASTGLPYFRLRLSQVINGTGTVTLQTSISTAAQVGAVTVTGSVGINYMPGAGTDNTPVPGSTLWVGGMYNSTPETYISGYEASFQMDVHGNLYTDQNYWAGTALGAPTNFGTTPGAVTVPSVNASLFQGTTAVGAGAPLQVSLANTGANGTAIAVTMTSTTVTGTVAVTQSTSPWVDNITQWASTALGTPQTFGTAPSGVVIGTSSDLYVAGTRARSNQTTTAAGVQDVNIVGSLGATNSVTNGTFMAITDNTTKVGVIATTTALKTDLSSVAGTATVTAAAGVQKVGIVGNANATLDSTIGAATAPTNALATSVVYQTTVPALTAGQAVAVQSDTTGSMYVNTEGRKQTYRMATRAFTPVASATSPCFSIQGSGTKTVRVTRIVVTQSCLTGTATPFAASLSVQKFSALTGGTTGNTPTGSLLDSGNAAQTAVCLQYSAVPTTATTIGGIHATELIQTITSSATVNGTIRTEFDFGDKNGQGAVLRGTAQYLGIIISAVGTTPLMSVWVEWVEDNS